MEAQINHYNCIYMYINKINGKRYIGQTIDFNRRHKEHIRHNKSPLEKAMQKYGEENFEIIILKEDIESQCLLNLFECYYIKKYNTVVENKKGYNISDGGFNGNPYAGKTKEEMEEIRRKMSENHAYFKGENHPMYGKHHSEEAKRKMSETQKGEKSYWYGKKHSEETKQKMSKARQGENNPMYGKGKIIAQYDKQGNLIKVWNSSNEIKHKLNISQSSIIACCKFWEMDCNKEEWHKTHTGDPRKSAGGFIWKYYKKG